MLLWINQVISKGKALGTRLIPDTSSLHQGPLATLKDTRGHLERVSSRGYLWPFMPIRCNYPTGDCDTRLTRDFVSFLKWRLTIVKKIWQKSLTPIRTIRNRKGNEQSSDSVQLEPISSSWRKTRRVKRVRASHEWFWFCFWLDDKVARDFKPIA